MRIETIGQLKEAIAELSDDMPVLMICGGSLYVDLVSPCPGVKDAQFLASHVDEDGDLTDDRYGVVGESFCEIDPADYPLGVVQPIKAFVF